MTALFSEHTVQKSPGGMDAIGTELAANRLCIMKASRIKRSGHRMWRCTCEGFQTGINVCVMGTIGRGRLVRTYASSKGDMSWGHGPG